MRPIDSIRRNSNHFQSVAESGAEKLAHRLGGSGLESVSGNQDHVEQALEGIRTGGNESTADPLLSGMQGDLEAIILGELRPAYFITNDQIEVTGDYDYIDLIQSNKVLLEDICKRAGSIDLLNHMSMDYVGTGWLIEDNIVVTNRHVSEAFARPNWPSGWDFAPLGFRGRNLLIELNTGRQKSTGSRPTLLVEEILYVAGPREPDIALLRVRNDEGMQPIPLKTTALSADTPVAAVGYPASDADRNNPDLMSYIFGGEYRVKRFSPGLANSYTENGVIMLSDYTTLGGNSGSVVLSLETGEAVGLHFAGVFKETNYAVAADIVAATLRNTKSGISLSGLSDIPEHSERRAPDHFIDRNGYDPEFLGDGELRVDYPDLRARKIDVAPVDGAADSILRYTHFSVIQSKSRRLPMLTAVNIDGAKAFKLKRKGSWHTDGRVQDEHQIGNVLYKHNPLDRGHMVRRKDPGWGDTKDQAQQGEIDTFMYTNCAPQHKDLNQKDWVKLEDYILEAAETRDFKVSVMTGPVFQDNDKKLKSQPGAEHIQIPEAYWKLAVMVNTNTGKLSATAYLLTQGDLIRNLTEAEFVLGKFKTYQIKLTLLSDLTGLDFGHLTENDPLNIEEESLFGSAARSIDGADSIVLG